MMKGATIILDDTIDEQQRQILSLTEAAKSRKSVEVIEVVPESDLESNRLHMEEMETNLHELIKRLKLGKEKEKFLRLEAENEKRLLMSQLADVESELKSTRAEVTRLRKE